MTATTQVAGADERLVEASLVKRLLSRPELGALGGAIIVWVFFAIVATDGWLSTRGVASYLETSAQIGILAVAVSLLMIGGEFDLSVGSMIGFAGVTMAMLSTEAGIPLFFSSLIALALALVVGMVNGYMVIKTKLPSFIITLGGLFIIRGLTIFVTRQVTGRTQIGSLNEAPGFEVMRVVFDSQISIGEGNFPVSIVWWLLFAAVATWVLLRTSVGNWIFGTGGAAEAARNVGVPVDRLKIGLFMLTAFAAWLVATVQIVAVKSADTKRGEQQEFIAIIAVVIGGTLLTGGYGSAIGALLGALIFGMVRQGIVMAGAESDLFQVFMGGMLIAAVLVNSFIRKRAEEARR